MTTRCAGPARRVTCGRPAAAPRADARRSCRAGRLRSNAPFAVDSQPLRRFYRRLRLPINGFASHHQPIAHPAAESRPLVQRVPPEGYFLVSAVFHYLGPAFAVLLFARVDVLGVAWLRIASAAA